MNKQIIAIVFALTIIFSDFAWDVTAARAMDNSDGFSWAQLFSLPLDGVGDSPLVP